MGFHSFARRGRLSTKRFTLIELLMVVVVIMIIGSMLLPAITKTRQKALQANCIANLKQHGMTTRMYLDDFEETYPSFFFSFSPGASGNIVILVKPKRAVSNGFGFYEEDLLTCPADETPGTVPVKQADGSTVDTLVSYGVNIDWVLAGSATRLAHLNPELVPVFYDGSMSGPGGGNHNIQGHYDNTRDFAGNASITRHRFEANYLFADWHVESSRNIDAYVFCDDFGNGNGIPSMP